MIEVDLREYAPVVTNTNVAEKIYKKIIDAQPTENEVIINMDGMISMSVVCVNSIFGRLYDELGCDKFHENLLLKGISDTLGDFMSYILSEREKAKNKK